ncbi:unnamed protein product, partial [Discosporangium mesarthrocarpum]
MEEHDLPFQKGERVIVVGNDRDGSGNKTYRAATIIMVSVRSIKRQRVAAFKVYYAGTARGLADEFVELGSMLKANEENLALKKAYEDRIGIKAPGRHSRSQFPPSPSPALALAPASSPTPTMLPYQARAGGAPNPLPRSGSRKQPDATAQGSEEGKASSEKLLKKSGVGAGVRKGTAMGGGLGLGSSGTAA